MAPRLYSALLAGAILTTSIATSEIAQAAALTCSSLGNVSGATNCFDSLDGNDSLAELESLSMLTDFWINNGGAKGFLSKINSTNTSPDEGNTAALSIAYDGGAPSTTGTWMINPSIVDGPFALVLKGGPGKDGPGAIYYTFADNSITSGTWNTSGLDKAPDLSHISLYTAVPTPALLPGLIGFGMSIVRKRKQQQEDGLATA